MKTLKFLMLLITLSSMATTGFATIFYSKNEAMELAFGKGAQIESLSLFPDDNQIAQIQAQAKAKLDSGLFTFYAGKAQGKITGYAAIETSTVRTKPETLLIVLAADGQLRNIYTLAFHEPPEYLPPQRWYDKLLNRPLADMDFNKGVDGISGATLSARSALEAVRKVMAVYEVMLKNQDKH